MAEGRLLVAVLQQRLADLDQSNRRAIGEALYRQQGRALELEDIIGLLGVSATTGQPTPPKRPPASVGRIPIVNHMAVPD